MSEADIDETVIEKERAVLIAQAEESEAAEIAAKMVEGRLRKFRKEICLLDQPFVKNPDLSVAGEVDRVAKEPRHRASGRQLRALRARRGHREGRVEPRGRGGGAAEVDAPPTARAAASGSEVAARVF